MYVNKGIKGYQYYCINRVIHKTHLNRGTFSNSKNLRDKIVTLINKNSEIYRA